MRKRLYESSGDRVMSQPTQITGGTASISGRHPSIIAGLRRFGSEATAGRLGPTVRETPRAKSKEWADIDLEDIENLIAQSEAANWRQALAAVQEKHPFFVKRLTDTGLGNWHLLLLSTRAGAALDVGCGFGTLALGLGEYFREVMGVDILPERLRFAALRAEQEQRTSTRFVLMDALHLRLPAASFELVTLNGMLEWAGLFSTGSPCSLQLEVLRQIRPLLKSDGHLALAIENRFAMETLAGMHDTHSNLRFLPALPRIIADLAYRAARQEPLRSHLYSRSGYQKLLRAAGFESVRVLDLVSSYNDYDFIVQPDDGLSYRFLWQNACVRTFYSRAGRWRQYLVRVRPSCLVQFGYAYLVLAGRETSTVLDASHHIWSEMAKSGLHPGPSRFGCKETAAGNLAILCHDGKRATGVLEYGVNLGRADDIFTRLPASVRKLVNRPCLVRETEIGAVRFRGFVCEA